MIKRIRDTNFCLHITNSPFRISLSTPNKPDERLIEAESVLSSMTDEEYAQAVRVLHALKQK